MSKTGKLGSGLTTTGIDKQCSSNCFPGGGDVTLAA